MPRIRNVTEETQAAAELLRKRLTPAEQMLWGHLRGRRLNGLKFRRQQPIGPYIADFYCAERRLIVELDGGAHEDQVEYDAGRTEYFEAHGFRVIRFWNWEVAGDLDQALGKIAVAAGDSPHPPAPSPKLGEGE